MQPTTCANCEKILNPGFAYCPKCGQAAHLHPINGSTLLHESIHAVTHADKGIFFLIKELAIRPGVVAREFIAGKRKKYFPPFNFFFIVVGLFVLTLTSAKTFERNESMESTRVEVREIPDPVKRNRILAKIDRAEAAGRFMAKYSNFVSMVAVPLMAVIFFLFYFRRGYNFTEHLVANLYFVGFGAIFFIVVATPLISILPRKYYLVGIGAYLVFTLFYRAIAYYQFMNRKGGGQFLYAFFASFAGLATWSVLTQWLIYYYRENGFKI